MKKLLVAACLFVSMFGIAQDEKMSAEDQAKMEQAMKMMFGSKISMDIDSKLLPVNEGNTYINEEQTLGIVAMIIPQTYAKMKEKLNDTPKNAETKLLDKGEVTLGGQKMLFQKASKMQDGKEIIVLIFCKENDAESAMMITGFSEKGKENEFKPHIEKAAASAKLVQ